MKDKKIIKEDIKFHIEEIIGTLKESDKHDWAKSIIRIKWGDAAPTVDIRNFNFNTNIAGKGISLSDEETEELVNILVEKDYGSMDILKKAVKRKMSRFSTNNEEEDEY
jgi:hypothetical protein